ncbi:MAG: threonylcarbamoyl-AMP synthase [Clostridia bacterium]|nr:threonylcarbamoyl-AMP synthase [Clostridia bacterium]
MKTCIYNLCEGFVDDVALEACARFIKDGGLVAFPTETVYGLGCNGFDEAAVESLYEAKNRPLVKPISLCVHDLSVAESVAVFDDRARALFKAFMPGPLTVVLPKRPCVPDIVTAGLDSVGIRVPSNPIALKLSKLSGVPIALPSANLSGQGALTDGNEVVSVFDGKIDAVINAGRTEKGMESTIVSLVGEPRIIRCGAISDEALEPYLK